MNTETIQQAGLHASFAERLDADTRHPALVAEAAIRTALQAARDGDAALVHVEVEFAKYVVISRRCGMANEGCDLMAVIRSSGLAICSALSNVSEMAQVGRLDGSVQVLAEAAMRTHALAG